MKQVGVGIATLALAGTALVAGAGTAAAEVPARQRVLAVPLCPGPLCARTRGVRLPAPRGPRLVYLNFEGVTLTVSSVQEDPSRNISAIPSSHRSDGDRVTVPAFDVRDIQNREGLSRSQVIAQVKADLDALHAPYDIEYTTTRPSSSGYQMIVFGSDCETIANQACAGIALLDCAEDMNANITFAFPYGLRVEDLVTTAAQEAAHAFGLVHTEDATDVMYPYLDPSQETPYHYGTGRVPSADREAGLSCGRTQQNSHQLMLDIIGPRGQDVTAPTVRITAPGRGDVVDAGAAITVTASDADAVTRVVISVDGDELASLTAPPYQATLPALADGSHQITAIATDPSGNRGTTSVTVSVGIGATCSGPADCHDGLDCVDGACAEPEPVGPGGDGELGDVCTIAEDCTNGQCSTDGVDSFCTQACDAAAACPAGFDCLGTACWPASGDGGGDSGGCQATTAPTPALGALLGALVAAAVTLGRRRRR